MGRGIFLFAMLSSIIVFLKIYWKGNGLLYIFPAHPLFRCCHPVSADTADNLPIIGWMIKTKLPAVMKILLLPGRE